MNLDIYWHVYLVNNWRAVVWEQLDLLRVTGLLKQASRLYVSIIDPDGCFLEFMNMTHGIEKLVLIGVFTAHNQYEFPTLEKLYRDCVSNQHGAVLYMHTKGVSYVADDHQSWRNVCHEVIRHWEECMCLLQDGYDVAGQNYLESVEGRWPDHFSGNFWMATRAYVATLKPPAPSKDRFQAEWWICSGKPMVFALPFVEHFCT